ncbi:MAG: type III secretion system cytoplasmic ring protein SctQ [Desulfovibrionaceae bacterium]|nr:type III secretion system cytoplasmic ring protein SctQ [Desulfovibrionaceae bacterium]
MQEKRRDSAQAGAAEESETLLVRLSFAKSASAAAVSSLFNVLPLRKNGFLVPLAPRIPLELSLEAGFVRLPRDAVSSLAPDDVLIPEDWKLPKALLARIWHGGGCLCATCALEGTNAALTSPLTEDTMEPTETSDLELRLSFELERRLITLGDLSALEPGYTFALGCDTNSPVTIRVNGKALAQGRLVDMNGTLGVQVLHTL